MSYGSSRQGAIPVIVAVQGVKEEEMVAGREARSLEERVPSPPFTLHSVNYVQRAAGFI